jgi:hypothetical protein
MQFRFLSVAVLTCLVAGQCLADQPNKAKAHRGAAPVAAVAAPAVPLRPEQMPATPPQVAFQHGLLIITAENSTLGDILRAVRNQTGAAVDVPGNATERVVGSFGPGPARDVLSSLLNGSHFNYVLLGSATNPDALEHVILTVKSSADPSGTPPEAASAAPPAPAQNSDMAVEDQPDQNAEDSIFAEDPPGQADEQAPAAPPTRTPEQMLQDLQHQQEVQQQIQQRQQQLGLPPNAPGPRGIPMPAGAQPQPQ